MVQPIRDRKLPERSKLVFEFPVPQRGGGKFVVTLPFFENIKINETKKANYVKYNLLARSSQLYTYTGSDSRKFSLEFVMSFPHILEEHSGNLQDYLSFVDSEDPRTQQALFLKAVSPIAFGGATIGDFASSQKLTGLAKVLRSKFLGSTYSLDEKLAALAKLGIATLGGGSLSQQYVTDSAIVNKVEGAFDSLLDDTKLFNILPYQGPAPPETSKHNQLLDLVMYWTNIVRGSVVNHSENPVYGPPVVRINHGMLFQNIPCICTDYSIEPLEEGGYDVGTLLPRRIRYTMNLEELRAGDFGEFDPATRIGKDNLVGWEAVVTDPHQSMDPGYDL